MQRNSWERFKSHTLLLEGIETKSRLVTFIAACTDPFADEIRYHATYWRKYIRPTSDDHNSIPYQNVQRMEIDQLFIHVRKVIFQDNEPRTLKGLLDDYNHMLSNHNFPKCERTSKLKSKNLEMQSVSIIDFRKIKALSFTFQKEAAIQKLQLMLGEFLMTIYYAMLLVGWENKKFYKPYMAATSKVFGLVEISNCKPEECTMNNPQIVALGDLLLAYLFPGKFQVNVASPNFLLLCKICENMGFP